MANRGKQFEQKFREQWAETVSDSMCYRLFDTTAGFKGIGNVGDFICYKYPNVYLIDCKSSQGNTLNFSMVRQYDLMIQYANITGVKVGIIWWAIDHDKVLWVPIETFEQLKKEDKKSFNIKMVGEYECLELPSKKLRAFMETDYSVLIDYYKEK